MWPDLWERGTAGSKLGPGCTQETLSGSTLPPDSSCQTLPWGKTSIWKLARERGEQMIGVWPACRWESGTGKAPCTRICCRARSCRPPGISCQAPGQKGRSGFRHSWHLLQPNAQSTETNAQSTEMYFVQFTRQLEYIVLDCQKLRCTKKGPQQ